MFLERIEIKGFRGINRLSLSLDNTIVLIGENAWGKSSLLRALWCLLGQEAEPYQFGTDDFHRPEDPELAPASSLQLVLTFSEHRPEMCLRSQRLARLAPVWIGHKDKFHRIHYRASAELQEDGSVQSRHDFLDGIGKVLEGVDSKALVSLLITMNPVFRLRDARSARTGQEAVPWQELSEHRLDELMTKLGDEPQRIGEEELKEALSAVRQLTDHYFKALAPIKYKPRSQREIINRPMTLRNPGNLQSLLRGADNRALQLAMAGMAGALLNARGNRELEQGARPIMILEDPESRLHPTMLSLAWGLLEQLPGQKLLTTNSGDLLSSLPLNQVRRLVRRQQDILCHQLGGERYSSEDLRKIAFHVRINRPMSLFARCWLLVEGETEIWLLSELAQICGYSLRAEGVRIIEFAQCGHAPLIKVARDFGIEWHLLTDGDEAGAKYASSARSLLKGEREQERLTQLPAADIEHYLYRNGFEAVYRREAGVGGRSSLSASRIINKAIHHRSKPGMALAVVEEAERLGREHIPLVIRQMFKRVVAQARGQG
ncbi:ATP-dependent endonuclease [Aeromonas bivalvium]|uniref:ATP-dependent endonuclease n=1 Tax=Aeromonas bivalvium TaxID=440079 RepID=A0ABW9GN41_9GAMM|nr:ATP-dependent endonuclease [Aeromonas bivalvium]